MFCKLSSERYHADGIYPQNDKNIVTLGGAGFGVMAIIVGIEQGLISREEGVGRLERIVDFLTEADRFNGVRLHWLNDETGDVKPLVKMMIEEIW